MYHMHEDLHKHGNDLLGAKSADRILSDARKPTLTSSMF